MIHCLAEALFAPFGIPPPTRCPVANLSAHLTITIGGPVRIAWVSTRGLVAAATALLVMPFTAGAAEAAATIVYGKGATIEFVELGAMPGAPGNAHSSHLEFLTASDGSGTVRGYIFHYDCVDGFAPTPTQTYQDAYHELESECTFLDGTESLESGDVTIRMAHGQSRTRLTGYFDASLSTQPVVPFNLTFEGFGPITVTETTNRGPRYKHIFQVRARAASVEGTIAGVLETDVLTEEITKIVGGFDTSFCDPTNTTLKSILDQIRQASDIMKDGTQDPTKECDGISIGLGFNLKRVTLGDVAPPATPKDPCAPGTGGAGGTGAGTGGAGGAGGN